VGRRLAGGCICVLVFFGHLAESAPARSCARGDNYLEAGLLARAKAQYRGRLSSPCGQKGLRNVAERKAARKIARAKAFALAGREESADEAIKRAIELDPRTRLLDRFRNAQARAHVAKAKAFANIGRDEEAQAEIKQAIALYPSVHIPDRLKDVDRNSARWDEIKSDVGPVIRDAVETLAIVALLVVLVIAVLRGLRRFFLHLTTGEFNAPGNDTLAKGLPVSLQDHVQRISRGAGGFSLYQLNTSGEAVAPIPAEVTQAFPQAGLAAAAISLLGQYVPSRSWKLSGAVRGFDEHKGAGLTLVISKRTGAVVDEVTLWQGDYGPVPVDPDDAAKEDAYFFLTIPGAVWAIYAINGRRWFATLRYGRRWLVAAMRSMGRRLVAAMRSIARTKTKDGDSGSRIRPLQAYKAGARDFRMLGTDDWKSYALFASAVFWAERRDETEARRRYWRALDQDEENEGALFNLATSYLGDHDVMESPDGKQVYEQLAALKDVKEKSKPSKRTDDPLWYRAAYVDAAARLWRAEIEERNVAAVDGRRHINPALLRRLALALALEVATDLEGRLCNLRFRWTRQRRRKEQALRDFLTRNEGGTVTLLASLLLENDEPVTGASIESRRKLLKSLKRARKQPTASPRRDVRLPHGELVQFVETQAELNGRTCYNLACYYSRRGAMRDEQLRHGDFEESLEKLDRALDLRPDFASSARVDPGLDAVRSDDDFWRRFDDMLAKRGAGRRWVRPSARV
jgi:tetratricopeptide (TPR) repeat protein